MGRLEINQYNFFFQKIGFLSAVKFKYFWSSKPWIRMELQCWIRIRIETNADPQKLSIRNAYLSKNNFLDLPRLLISTKKIPVFKENFVCTVPTVSDKNNLAVESITVPIKTCLNFIKIFPGSHKINSRVTRIAASHEN
jgi:hypothetical protein